MNQLELIKELRALTAAGMKDCKDSLVESNWDLQAAVDLVKVKGLNLVSSREGKVAAEGRVSTAYVDGSRCMALLECNSQTDFVANSPDFKSFMDVVMDNLVKSAKDPVLFLQPLNEIPEVEAKRKELSALTKENIVVRRWWVSETQEKCAKIFSYVHSNSKIAVILTMKGPSEEAVNSTEFAVFAEDIAMQIAAMNPLAVSKDTLNEEDVARQTAIFETQLKELNKPQAAWAKIIEGKTNKWLTEVCLLDQESVVHPKTTVRQVLKNAETKFGGEITAMSFTRCQVGEGIELEKKLSLAEEVRKISGVEPVQSLRAYKDVLKG